MSGGRGLGYRWRPGRRRFRRWVYLCRLVPVLVAAVFLAGCPQRVVRIPVPEADIIRSNEATQQADMAFARRDFYTALIKYLEAGRLNPNSEFIQNKLGITYSQLKYYSEAVSAFQRSIALNPKYPYSVNNLGSVYFAMNDLKRAEKRFRSAIGLSSEVASFHVNLGALYIEKKQTDKGMIEWRKALALDPAILTRTEGINLQASSNRGSPMERAYFKARLFAAMGDVVNAVLNLQEALVAGFTDIKTLRTEHDFDGIRADEKFVAFMKTALMLTAKQ
jgi:tetratricopeptide (TPR) repeat protein